MKRSGLFFLIGTLALVSPLTTPDVGFSIDIILVWDDLDENPEFDPDGTKLMAVANAAAQIWEPLIRSSGTHHVDVSWSYLDDTARGLWKLDPFGNNNIYFDTDTDWFIDSTPLVNEEFDFGDPFTYSSGKGSFLYGTTTDADDWFDRTTPPGTLEIGYVGLPKATAPPEAISNADLLSVILHELGHDLGVGGDVLSGRYPIYPAHISGLQDVEVIESDKPDSGGFAEEHGHMAPIMALMSQTVGNGKRTLPSALDVIVAARDSNYTSVDLKRKFVGIGTNWNSGSTWIGGRLPDGTDDAYVVHGGTVTLSATGRTDNLYISRDSIVATGAHSLTVDNRLALKGFGDVLRVNSGGSATIGTIEVRDESTVEMSGGTLNVVSGGSIGGALTGRGTVDFDGQVVVSGVIEADGGTLEMTGSGSILLLETQEPATGRMLASTGNLKLGLPFAAGSNGTISVDPGRSLVITRDLTIPRPLQVSLGGTLASEGADTDVTIGHLNVGYDSTGQVLSRTLTLNDYGFLDPGGHLTLASSVRTTLQGGLSMYGGGTLKQDGDISVTGGVVNLAMQTLDWGNSTPTKSNDLTIHPNSMLEVNSSVVGTFRGELTVNSAVLQVDTPGGWQLGSETATTAGGMLSLIKSGAATPIVRGTPLTARHWIVTSGGDTFIESDLTVMPTATVVVFGGSRLFLMGNTTLRGGSISGLGDLVQRGDIDVTDDTTIDTERFAWGNSLGSNLNTLTVHRGRTLTVNSASTDDTNNQFRGGIRLDGGTLVVNTDAGWALPAQQLFLVGGALELDGTVVAPHVQGQPLAVAGRIYVTGGPAHLDSEVGFQSTQQTDIAAGATLHVNGVATYAGGSFTGAGTLQHNGTALLASNNPLIAPRFVQNGLLTILNPSNNAAIQAPVIDFQPASRTRVIWDLHLRGNAVMRPGAMFEGGGTLVVDPTGSFTGGGNLGVSLENQGTVRPGFSPGTLSVIGDYAQGASAELHIDLAGATRGAWDLLSASGAVSLDGSLNVFLLGGYTPALGESFTIVTARGGVSGTFSDAVLPPLPAGQTWSIEYDPTSVVLSTTTGQPGDINGDGGVDRKDVALFATHLGTGATTLADLHTLQSNLGQGVRSPAALANAVPEPATWLLAAFGAAFFIRLTATRRGARLKGVNPLEARSPLGRG
jgi:hypothetical protein